jgi:putative hydrolase of the HAD superfamily
MDGISTLLWDIGGVLLTNGWDRQQREAVLTRFGLDSQEFERRHAEVDQAWERDEIGVDEYLRQTVFYQARSFTQAEFLEVMYTQSAVLDDSGIGILRQLSASEQYVLATVNNESRAMNEFRLAKFDLLDDFDAFFSSCYLGIRKPDRRIYQVALDVLQRDPEEVIFIDDRPENVAAAASLGIHGIRYEGSAKLADELTQMGIVLPQGHFSELKVQEA